MTDICDGVPAGYDRPPALSASDRKRLWAALAEVPSLGWLCLHMRIRSVMQDRAEVAECELLRSVRCKELVLNSGMLWLPFAEQLLHEVDCETVLCRSCCQQHTTRVLRWSCLAAKPGMLVLEFEPGARLAINDCPGSLPVLSAPWALVLVRSQQSTVNGLPLPLFKPGKKDHLVWRSSDMTDARLEFAFTFLKDPC